jgi:tetratricopeptide (TPR) repeat protein
MDRSLSWWEGLLRLADVAMFRLHAWVFTRRWWLLVEGLPALLLAVGAVVLWVGQFRGPDRGLISRYDLAMEQALARDDLASAKVYVRKLVLLDEPGPRTRYALARLAEHEGDLPRARRLMSDLAPSTGPGYPSAHFWLAKRLLDEQAQRGPGPPGETQAVIQHLEQALVSTAHRQEAHERLAQLYKAKGDPAQAAKHLEEAAPQRPELYLQLAEVQLGRRDDVRFQRAAKQARDYFQGQVEIDRNDIPARISWAQVCGLEEEFEEAEKILEDGLAASNDARLREALTQTYLAGADRLGTDDPRELAQRLDLLRKSLQVSPNHPETLNRLAMFVRYSGPQADAARAMLKDLLAQAQVPVTVHLLLGSTAAADGKWEEARLHLEQAYRLDPRLPALLNNLAWTLTQGHTPDPERALTLADEAVKLAPDQPEMRATRGRIRARLQRWQDAVSDLEAALANGSDPGVLHPVLAEAYAALGDAEMAERHRALAAKAQPIPAHTPGVAEPVGKAAPGDDQP